MSADTKIQWTNHSFNPWRGCTKVSAGCNLCYAETLSKRNPKSLGAWGPQGQRVVAAESYWREPLKWNRAAAKAGIRARVFCASLADVFEDWGGPMHAVDGEVYHTGFDLLLGQRVASDFGRPATMADIRRRLFDLICRTPHLDWLVLTKRPENALRMMVEAGLYVVANPKLPCPQPNLWIGTSVEDQAAADERIPHLMATPAAVRFISAEPLLGSVQLDKGPGEFLRCAECGYTRRDVGEQMDHRLCKGDGPRIDWVIVGGESGPGARPCDVAWIRRLRDQCKAAGVACFVKQLGAHAHWDGDGLDSEHGPMIEICDHVGDAVLVTFDHKGGDPDEWPADLRVREFPKSVPFPSEARR